ncbi:hypothetical protein Tco_0731617, partial [Tanacetum coccineum]
GSVKKKFGHVKSIPQGHGGHENKLKLNIKAGEAAKKQVFKKTVNSKPNLKTLVKQKSKDVVISNAPVKPKPVKPNTLVKLKPIKPNAHVKPKPVKPNTLVKLKPIKPNAPINQMLLGSVRGGESERSCFVEDCGNADEGVSDEDVGECVSDEKRNDAGEGDSDEEDEEYKAKENYKDKESEKNVVFESDSESEDEIALKGGKKIKNVSKFKKIKHVTEPESSSEEERVSNPKKHVKRKKHIHYHLVWQRFVVSRFNNVTYEFVLDQRTIVVNTEKVHEILGAPLGGTSLFDLPERPLDDEFVKLWFKQFSPTPLKDIRANDIASMLVQAK